MARRKITQDFFEALLIAFRDEPGNYAAAARIAGCTERTARKGYKQGWPELPFAKVPIETLLMEERAIARARMQLQDEQEEVEAQREAVTQASKSEAARLQAIKAREEEGRLVAGARAAGILGISNVLRLAEPMKKVLDRLAKEFDLLTEKQTPFTAKERIEAVKALRQYSIILRDLTVSGQTAMEMERLFLGEPTSIIGITSDFDAMPLQELVEAAGYGDEVLQRAAARGMVILKGEKTDAN